MIVAPTPPGPILVVNPNSNAAVTEAVRTALVPFGVAGGPAIECVTLAEGPFGIETEEDIAAVAAPLAAIAAARADISALVIACYADPGLEACRAATAAPVFGVQRCGVLTACARAERFGVIAAGEASVARHRRTMTAMGVADRLAGERAAGLSVADTVGGEGTFERLAAVGRALVADGAGAVVLGCAGMARHRGPLEVELGVPVVDPVQAAVAMALGTVLAGAVYAGEPRRRWRERA